MDKKLLSCPHCDGEARLGHGVCGENVYQVVCWNSKRNAMAGWCETAGEAIAAWNQRVPAVEWVAVSERLPAPGERVIAVFGGVMPTEAFVTASGQWVRNGIGYEDWLGVEVTRWMPMPEPPEG